MSLKQLILKLWVCLVPVVSLPELEKQKEESDKQMTALERKLLDAAEKILVLENKKTGLKSEYGR